MMGSRNLFLEAASAGKMCMSTEIGSSNIRLGSDSTFYSLVTKVPAFPTIGDLAGHVNASEAARKH